MSNRGADSRTAAPPPWLDERAGALVLALHVQPGARRTAVVGVHGTRLKIAVACPPTEGRANAALLEFLAARLGIARSALALLSGASARDKRVAVRGAVDAAALLAALAPDRRP
jgi:uncharacterized protein (TIGR00251 family)